MKKKHVYDFNTFVNEKYSEIEYENGCSLLLKFTEDDEYFRAVDYFNSKSPFFASEYNSEFKTIYFPCDNQEDMDNTETEIDSELIENNFDNYYFESEM